MSEKQRLISLDAFRGLTIFLMLLVNNIGEQSDTPGQLTHAGWQGGVRLADFIFPWFLFCVGMAIPFSVAAFNKRNPQYSWLYDSKVLRRTIVLLALGCLISSSYEGHPVFMLGVLQIIGLAYCVGALLYDLPIHRRLFIAAVFLLTYWFAIKYLPIPGVGTGVFREGHNLIHHLNQKYLAPYGLEGLPLIIPTSALVLIATVIGDLMRHAKLPNKQKLKWLLVSGAVLIVVAGLWNLSISINKPLWTPSYILLTSGTGCIMLALFFWLIDIKRFTQWSFPFIVYGSNAILAYVAPILFKEWVLHNIHLGTAGLLRTLIFAIFWWFIMWLLYRKRWFFKV